MSFSTPRFTRFRAIVFECLGVHSGDIKCFGIASKATMKRIILGVGFLFCKRLSCQVGAFAADDLKHLMETKDCHDM